MRKTKIMITLGPSTNDYDVMREALNIANIVRLNFSHGDHREHRERLKTVREIEEEIEKPITAVADLKGPEVRTSNKDDIEIKKDKIYDFDDIPFDNDVISMMSEKDDIILIDDGKLTMRVVKDKGSLKMKAMNDYTIKPKRGVIIRGKDIPLSSPTERDMEDLEYIKKAGFDAIAQSFVKTAEDIELVREIVNDMPIIAKIESVSAVKHIESIVKSSDGVMIARGDLALSIRPETVPRIQRKIIKLCKEYRKPSIIATQMLDSMVKTPMPTRAEVSDVYNGVIEGADALMLSGETSKGDYPIEAIRMMDVIIREAEKEVKSEVISEGDFKDIMAKSAINIAHHFNVPIIAPTIHGTTPTKVSRLRPKIEIYSISPNKKIVKYMNMFYGIYPKEGVFEPVYKNFDVIKHRLKIKGKAVFIFGYPPGNHRTNNIIYI